MKKLLLGIAALGLIVIAGSLWWVYNSLDAQVPSAIRRYGSEITGVSISLSKAKIDPLGAKAALYGAKAAGKTIQKGMEAATKTLKDRSK